jgi:hypothetical protein
MLTLAGRASSSGHVDHGMCDAAVLQATPSRHAVIEELPSPEKEPHLGWQVLGLVKLDTAPSHKLTYLSPLGHLLRE